MLTLAAVVFVWIPDLFSSLVVLGYLGSQISSPYFHTKKSACWYVVISVNLTVSEHQVIE